MNAVVTFRTRGASHPERLPVTPVRLTLALILAALTVRLIGLELRPLWLDEAYSAWFSSRSWHVLWTEVPTYEPHPPFYYSLLKLWRGMFGGSAVALKSLSVLFGAAALPLVVAASAELEQLSPTGRPLLRLGVAGFLTACSPMLVLLDQEARPYPLLVLAYALGTLGVVRLFREFAGGPGRWASWTILAFGTELGLWAHGLGVIYALCLAGALAPAWLRFPFSRDRLVRGLAAAAFVALFYLPCLLMIIGRAGDWGRGWLTWNLGMSVQLLSLYALPLEALTIGSAVAAFVMILLLKRAAQFAFESRGWTAERAMVVLWLGPPVIAMFVSQLFVPIFLVRTLAATLAPAYVVMGGALARASSRRERIVLTAALVVTLTPTAIQYALRPASEHWDEVAAFLNRNVRSGDQVWLYPNDSVLPLLAAGARSPMRGIPGDYPAVGFNGPIRGGSPAVVSLTSQQAQRFAHDPAVRDVPTIWLVTRQSNAFDPRNDVPRSLGAVRRRGPLEQWGYIGVQPYRRSAPIPKGH
jgi:mannosyltransferase